MTMTTLIYLLLFINIILEYTKHFSIEGLASGWIQRVEGRVSLLRFPPRLFTPVSHRQWPFLLPEFATMNPFACMILSGCSLVHWLMSWMIRFPVGVPFKGPNDGLNSLITALSIWFGVDRENFSGLFRCRFVVTTWWCLRDYWMYFFRQQSNGRTSDEFTTGRPA